MDNIDLSNNQFKILIEVVPPAGPDTTPLLTSLQSLSDLAFNGFSVATNPVAKPRMSAMAMCALIQRKTGRPAILHCTTRDHNRLSLQGMLWGARALGIRTVLIATGDLVAFADRKYTTTVRDMDVYGLIKMARESGLQTGVVLDPHPESNGLDMAVERLQHKAEVGAQFAVTQPIYDTETADIIAAKTDSIGLPLIMGILPLRTLRHAEFLHQKVSGITVPKNLRERMARTEDTIAEGIANARELLALSKDRFAGACIMPPFDHYEILFGMLAQ